MWPAARRNSVALHTYKPGYWRDRGGLGAAGAAGKGEGGGAGLAGSDHPWAGGLSYYVETKVGGHVFDHLRMTCRDTPPASPARCLEHEQAGGSTNPQEDDSSTRLLWGDAQSVRRRFGGIPVSFWLGFEQGGAATTTMAEGSASAPTPPRQRLPQGDGGYEEALYIRYLQELSALAAQSPRPRHQQRPPQQPLQQQLPPPPELVISRPPSLPPQAPIPCSMAGPSPPPPPPATAAAIPPTNETDGGDTTARPPTGFPSWGSTAGAAVGGAGAGVAAAVAYNAQQQRQRQRSEQQGEEEQTDPAAGLARLVADVGEGGDNKERARRQWDARVANAPSWSPLRRFELMRPLGQGAHGATLLVTSKASGAAYVLKHSTLLPEAVNEARALLRLEGCPHVVRLLDVFVEEGGGHTEPTAYLQLEYCNGGDLRQAFLLPPSAPPSDGKKRSSSSRAAAVSDEAALAILRQLACGLKGMHARGVVHRDMSPANVLLSFPQGKMDSSHSSSGTIEGEVGGEASSSSLGGATHGMEGVVMRIADLGVATRLTASLPTAAHAAGSLPFMAPEVCA